MRIIVFSGKGGSGVSTLCAATAAAVAGGGERTLAFGLGPGLGDAFKTTLTSTPAGLSGGLFALEGRRRHGEPDEFRDWLQQLLDWRGMEPGLAEDLAALPGMNHVGRLLEMEACARSGQYDAIVVDAAPLEQFLDLPAALDASARWLDRLFAPRQATVFEPFLRVFAGDYASAGEEVLEKGRELLGRLASLRDLLTDVEVTSVRLVAGPGARSPAEVRQAISVLSLFSFAVDAVVVNGVLPPAVTDPFFARARAEQEEALAGMATAAAPVPVLSLLVQPAAPTGLGTLGGIAGEVYARRDPRAVFHRGTERAFERRDGHYVLSLNLPFARREDIRLEQGDDGVTVHLDGRRCVVNLPGELRYHNATAWTLENDVLSVTFEI